MSLNVKHNKIKNTAILYELLSRQITADVINDSNSPKSVKIFKEFFNKNTELGKEYALYQVLLEKKYKNDSHAATLVEAVIKSRRKLSNRRLNNEIQSIGRGLRKSDNEEPTQLYDIIDNISTDKRKNFAWLHGEERLRIYNKEKFNCKTYKVEL